MRKALIAFSAMLALPFSAPSESQVTAQIQLETVAPLSGVWAYRAFAGGSESAFTDVGAARRLVIRCNRSARVVSIVRLAVPAAAPALSVWTTSMSRSLPSRFVATGELIADIPAADPLLDAIAFSRGRFATGAAGAPLAALPVWPEVARVIEDCRS